MNVTKQVKMIQSFQTRYTRLQKDIQDRIKKITKPVEQYIKRRLKEEFEDANFYFLSSFQCGCLTDKWSPQVFIYRVNDLSYSPDGYWYEDTSEGYLIDGFRKHSPPVPTRRFLAFLKKLSDEIGVKITLVRQRPYALYEREQQQRPSMSSDMAECLMS